MTAKLKILFVEDVFTDAELIWREIERNNISFSKLLVNNREDFLECLKTFEPDIIISDFRLPGFDGMKALLLRNERTPFIPFILVTGSINEEVAVECMKAGADDYILKNNLSRLGPSILNSINKSRLQKGKKASEEKLRISEMRLQRAQSIAHVGNWELDLLRNIVWCSEEAMKIYGLDDVGQEFVPDKLQGILLPEYRPILDEALNRLLKYNEPYEVEYKIKRSDEGIIRSIFSKAELELDSGNEQVKIIGVIQDITDRKNWEEALENSEEKYRTIFENVQDLYYESSIDGIILEVSPSIKILSYGQYDREDLIGKSMSGFYSYQGERQLLMEALKETGSITDFEIALRNRDGLLIPCSISAMIRHDTHGRPEKIIGSIRDISVRKKAEETFEMERRMLRTLIDNLPDPIYVLDKECRKVIANKADIKNIGFEIEKEVIGKTDIELFPGQTGVRGYADNKEVISSGKPIIEREEDFIDRNGVKRWLLTSKFPLRDKDGNITGLVGIGHEITERKRVIAELQQSYMFSKSLLSTIPFGMDIVDENGTVLFQSDNFQRIFGENALGKKCWELYRDDQKQCFDCPLRKGISVGETEAYESHGVMGNRIFEINHTGMMYQGKKAMLEIFQDITERKENDEELIRSKEKAEESDRLKTAFLHNISHEIRTPMNAIVGFSALLAEPDVDVQSSRSYIDIILQSSYHLLSIITDIVDISNIEANLTKIMKNDISVNEILKSLYQQFNPKAIEKKINLIFQNGLSDSDALILTDSTKLIQILSNLISNALKFTEKGNIEISYRLKSNFLEFCITDTGIGISPEFQEKIFDRFYQIQNTESRLYEGTGLGLSISKAYVELLGGKMWLSSLPEKGTSFFFTIPFEKRVVETDTDHKKKGKNDYFLSVKKRILVAEDVESNFKLIRYFLSDSNVELLHVFNGKDAVEKCLSLEDIDMILMDIKMPVMDGYTAVKLIREKNTLIPIIAQTAYADDKEKAIECGCSGFIAKPFDKKGLLQIIREFI